MNAGQILMTMIMTMIIITGIIGRVMITIMDNIMIPFMMTLRNIHMMKTSLKIIMKEMKMIIASILTGAIPIIMII